MGVHSSQQPSVTAVRSLCVHGRRIITAAYGVETRAGQGRCIRLSSNMSLEYNRALLCDAPTLQLKMGPTLSWMASSGSPP
jgi:hypothetical protein